LNFAKIIPFGRVTYDPLFRTLGHIYWKQKCSGFRCTLPLSGRDGG